MFLARIGVERCSLGCWQGWNRDTTIVLEQAVGRWRTGVCLFWMCGLFYTQVGNVARRMTTLLYSRTRNTLLRLSITLRLRQLRVITQLFVQSVFGSGEK